MTDKQWYGPVLPEGLEENDLSILRTLRTQHDGATIGGMLAGVGQCNPLFFSGLNRLIALGYVKVITTTPERFDVTREGLLLLREWGYPRLGIGGIATE